MWKGGEVADGGHCCLCGSWLEHGVISWFGDSISASKVRNFEENFVTKNEACEMECGS